MFPETLLMWPWHNSWWPRWHVPKRSYLRTITRTPLSWPHRLAQQVPSLLQMTYTNGRPIQAMQSWPLTGCCEGATLQLLYVPQAKSSLPLVKPSVGTWPPIPSGVVCGWFSATTAVKESQLRLSGPQNVRYSHTGSLQKLAHICSSAVVYNRAPIHYL